MEDKRLDDTTLHEIYSSGKVYFNFSQGCPIVHTNPPPRKPMKTTDIARVVLFPIFLLAKFGYWLVREIRRQNEGPDFATTPRGASEVAASPQR